MLLGGIDGGFALGVASGGGETLIHPEDQRSGVLDGAHLKGRLHRRWRITGLLLRLRQVCSRISGPRQQIVTVVLHRSGHQIIGAG